MLEILTRLATLPVMIVLALVAFFILFYIFVACSALVAIVCEKGFSFMLSLIPKKITGSVKKIVIRINALFWVPFKKIVIRTIILILVPVIRLLSVVFRSLRSIGKWLFAGEIGDVNGFVLVALSFIIYLVFLKFWIMYSEKAFGEWSLDHPNAFIFHIFFLPASLFIIAFVWGGSIEKRKKEKELEELKLSWALDRIALKKHDEWAWTKNWEDSWKDRDSKNVDKK